MNSGSLSAFLNNTSANSALDIRPVDLSIKLYPFSLHETPMDELEEALSKKDITQEQFNLAIETSHRLKRGMLSNISSFIEYTKRCYEMIRKLRN